QAAAHPNQYSAAELVAFAARVLHDGGGLPGIDEVRAVLVDDAQDLTEGAVSVLRAWKSRGASVMLFGDPDTASNGFRGGRAEVLSRFAELFGPTVAEPLLLHERHRGPTSIRRAYASVVSAIGTRGVVGHREPLSSVATEADDEHWHRLLSASPHTEARAIADELRTRHILRGVPWSQLAVVTRSTGMARSLEVSLARMGVPTSRNASKQVLRDEAGARWLLEAAQLAYEMASGAPVDSEVRSAAVLRILTGPLGGCDSIEIRQLRLQLRAHQITLSDALRHPVQLELIGSRLGARAAAACSALGVAAQRAADATVEDVLWQIWQASPVASTWATESRGRGVLAEEANAALDAVVALFVAAKRFVERRPRESGHVFLAEQFDAAVPEDLIIADRGRDAVTVTTPSQLVGRSFDTVVIAGLIDGVWPNLRPRFSLMHADELMSVLHDEPIAHDPIAERSLIRSDEYRLFALAISRATQRVVLSAHHGEDSNVSVLFGDARDIPLTPQSPTRLRDLVGALRRQLVRAVERGHDGTAAASALQRLSEAGVPGANPDDWYGLREWSTREPLVDLSAPDAAINVSPSVIEKVEQSSLAWFVDAFAPAPASDAQATGTIVHAALEELGGTDGVTIEDFIEYVSPELDKLQMPAEWVRAQTERRVRLMLERLCQYLEQCAASGKSVVAAEAPFRLQHGSIVVRGVIDRIERTPSGAYYVVDLKTGKTHLTAAEVAESAQLQCYQLAIHEGAVEGVPAGDPDGAALLYVQTSAQSPSIRTQDALEGTAIDAAWQRIELAAAAMTGPEFVDFDEISDRGPTAARRYRIQVIPGVCA
ncbi:MAG: PD-(D/E)XK nuclease family protein, partial [Agromyces sp.]